MSTLKFKLTFLLLATILINVQGQTTINYVSGFGNPDNVSSTCNLFNINPPLYTVGTFKHWPVSGGVLRSTGEPIGLRTRGGTGLTSIRGVSYAIEYPVKSGYKYSITLNAYKIDDIAQSNASINFEIGARPSLPTSGTSPTACGSVLLNAQTSVQSAKISEGSIASKTASNVTALQNWVSPDNMYFFTILVYGGNNGEDATVFINSINVLCY